MQLDKQLLLDILSEDLEEGSPWFTIEDNIVDTSRWSEIHDFTFGNKDTGKFYNVGYSCGLTECQDESPFEYEGDLVEVYEVKPVEVTVIKYVAV